MSFFHLPLEVRLYIYHLFLQDHRWVSHRRQPNNAHFALLHTCRAISLEAALLRTYVSLTHDSQITFFVSNVSDQHASQITSVDVANDARMVTPPSSSDLIPASDLYLALRKIVHISRLRVFEARRNRPAHHFISGARFSLQFEKAMFPFEAVPRLMSYELHLVPSASPLHTLFRVLPPADVQTLRLSGGCVLYRGSSFPSLRHLTICGVTGHYLDQHIEEHLTASQLKTFQYSQGDRLGFELSDHLLLSLAPRSASTLSKLVLLGCSKLSTAALTQCLRELSSLEYFALFFVTVHELRVDFVSALPPSLVTLKLSVTNAFYARPLVEEENDLCDALESFILLRNPPLRDIHLHFREEISSAQHRYGRWMTTARVAKFMLDLGPWEMNEII